MAETFFMMGILLSSFYIFKKAIKYTVSARHIILCVFWCLILPVSFAALSNQIQPLALRPLIYMASIIFLLILTKLKLDTVISAYLLSLGFSYVFLNISLPIAALILRPLLRDEQVGFYVDYDRPFYLLLAILTVALQLFLSHLLFRIRRFKNGFPFLLKGYAVILALMIAGAALAFSIWVAGIHEPFYIVSFFVAGILIIGVGIYIWIIRSMAKFQWKKTMLRNIELLEQELAAKDSIIKNLTEKLEIMRVSNHKIIQRLEAMELKVARQTDSEFNEDFVTIEDIRKLQDEYQEDIGRIKGAKKLASAKVKEIDNMLEYYAQKFAGDDIDFHLKISGSIPYMTEHMIDKNKLATMIGDHLQDAFIAVNTSENPFRSVLVVLGLVEDCYEFSVSDSGVSFEADTLAKLGALRVTTHMATGGSGIGFMTTFETMRECGASLVIDEKELGGAGYSKSVTIRFDGKNQYIIRTHRSGVFPASERYLVIDNTKQEQDAPFHSTISSS